MVFWLFIGILIVHGTLTRSCHCSKSQFEYKIRPMSENCTLPSWICSEKCHLQIQNLSENCSWTFPWIDIANRSFQTKQWFVLHKLDLWNTQTNVPRCDAEGKVPKNPVRETFRWGLPPPSGLHGQDFPKKLAEFFNGKGGVPISP